MTEKLIRIFYCWLYNFKPYTKKSNQQPFLTFLTVCIKLLSLSHENYQDQIVRGQEFLSWTILQQIKCYSPKSIPSSGLKILLKKFTLWWKDFDCFWFINTPSSTILWLSTQYLIENSATIQNLCKAIITDSNIILVDELMEAADC